MTPLGDIGNSKKGLACPFSVANSCAAQAGEHEPLIFMQPSKIRWNFHCLISDRGVDTIDKWRDGLSKTAKANLDRALEHLRVQKKTEWDRPHASSVGNHIYVIRFKDENRTQWRLFGHFYDEHNCFVATLGGTERDGVYFPSGYKDSCAREKIACDQDFARRTKPCLLGCDLCNPKQTPGTIVGEGRGESAS